MPVQWTVSRSGARFGSSLSACTGSRPFGRLSAAATMLSPPTRLLLLTLLLIIGMTIAPPAPVAAGDAQPAPLQLTAAEKAWLADHTIIRVGMSPVFPPLKFTEQGVIKGIEPDYLALLSEYTGIRFEYVVSDFSTMDAKVKSGEIDMFISFNIPERQAYMTFTEPLMDFKQVIVTRSDVPFISGLSALRGKRVATVKGVKLHEKQLAPYPEITTVPVATMEEMFSAVSQAKADALIIRTFFAGYLINNYPNLKISGVADLPPEPFLYAVRKDYPELVTVLNKAIAAIPSERRDAVIQKWFSMDLRYTPNWTETLKWGGIVSGLFALILGLAFFWNNRLRREISSRIATERTLRESEEQLKVIFETSEAGIILVSPQGIITFSNKRMADMVGVTLAELIGTTYREHLDESERQTGDSNMHRLIQGEIQSVGVDRKYLRKDGTSFWGHLSGRRLENPDGSLRGLVGVIDDITERKRDEEELQKKNAEIEQFIYTVSHDLRSPLVTVKTFMGYLEQDMAEGNKERLAQDIAYIHAAADKMKLLLDELLEMSRIDRIESAPVEVSFMEVLAEALDALAGAISKRNVDIHLPEKDLMMFGDRMRLCQIWQNLIENAIKYCHEDVTPCIQLGVRLTDQEPVFFVKDNGIGIAPEFHAKVFGMFDKLDPKSPGAGLGLSMVKRIIEKKGGRIWIESGEAEPGSCFLFTLPNASVST